MEPKDYQMRHNQPQLKKIYVKCGDLSVVLMASSPQDALQKAYENYGEGKMLDEFVYMDERGFRGMNDSQYAVPIQEIMN